jgi:lysophospholipase L1-like esterase
MNLHSRPLILLFGDSITQQGFGWPPSSSGWVSFLARDYSRRADVLNRGFSGYNTDHAVEILTSILPADSAIDTQEFLFSTVFFGANDAARPGEMQHVPVDTYGKNLAKIVTQMKKSLKPWRGKRKCVSSKESLKLPIILITPPPVDRDAWFKERGSPKGSSFDRTNETAKVYGDVVKEVGKKMNCSVLDVFELLEGNGEAKVYGKYLRDGLHLSESGNELLYKGLMDLIENEYPYLSPMFDGSGKYGEQGVPLEGSLWGEMCERK